MLVVDTNLLVRYFANDNKSQSKISASILEGERAFYVSPEVISEFCYVMLGSVYAVRKDELVVALKFLLSLKGLNTEKHVLPALYVFEKNNLSIVDSLVISKALDLGELTTFDKKMIRVFNKLKN